jgi:hypothetical protein
VSSSGKNTVTHTPISLCDALDRLLNTGAVIQGDIVISVADVDLIRVSLRALIAAVDALAEERAETVVSHADGMRNGAGRHEGMS